MKNYSFLSLFLIFIFCQFSALKSQVVCDANLTKKYVTITEKISGTAKLTSITPHGVLAYKGGFWMFGLCVVSGGSADFFVCKANDTGKILMFKNFGTSNTENAYSVRGAVTPSGGVVITGSTNEATAGNNLAIITAFDNTGNIKWMKRTPVVGNNGKPDYARSVAIESNGDIVMIGDAQHYSNLAYSRVMIYKLDSSGNQIFNSQIDVKNAGNSIQAHPIWITISPLGYLISGWFTSTANNAFLMLVSTSGSVVSTVSLNSTSLYTADRHIVLPSGKIIVYSSTQRTGNSDPYVACVNPATGTILWQKSIPLGTGTSDVANHIMRDGANLYLSVQTNALGGGGNREALITLDTNGNMVQSRSTYFGTRRFATQNTAQDFDFLKTNGMVLIGQDNGAAGVRFNYCIQNPCDATSCANHTQTFTPTNTNLTVGLLTTSSTSLGSLYNLTPNSSTIPMNEAIECRIACQQPKKILQDTVLLCSASSSVSVDGTQATTSTYSWDDGSTNPKKTISATGRYFLSTNNGCGVRKDTLDIIIGSNPTTPSFKDTTFCTTGWTLYKNVAQTGCTYIWDNASTKSYRTFTYPGNFWLQTSNSCGSRIDTIKIRQGAVVVMPPKLVDTGLCIGENFIVNITPKPFHHYTWDDGDTLYTKSFMTTGKKVLTVSTQCESKEDSFTIVQRRKPVKAPIKDTSFCALPILYNQNGFQPSCTYLWSDGTSTSNITITRSGKWYLLTSNRCGVRTDSIIVSKDTIPLKATNDNEYFCQGQPLTIKAYQPIFGNYIYQWSNGDKGPETKVPYTATISLITSNACGTRTDFINVFSYRCDCEPCIPNVFTPLNADGRNDEWRVRFDCKYTDCFVKTGYYSIFDRWGNCIIHKRDVMEPWNGIDETGDVVPEGIYIYTVHGVYDTSVQGTRTFDYNGTITVLSPKKE